MDNPLINIITRGSRETEILDCIKSVDTQTYENIHHIITYETDVFKEYLLKHINTERTTLCRVHRTKLIDGLIRKYWYYEGMQVDDIEYSMYKEGDVVSSFADPFGATVITSHFPFDLYILKAEQHVKDGWVLYLDDDNWLYNNKSIEVLVNHIKQNTDDTLYWLYVYNKNDSWTPERYVMHNLKHGTAPPLYLIGSMHYCFHSKYIPYTCWEGWYDGDWKTAESLYHTIPNKKTIETQPIVDCSYGSSFTIRYGKI